MTEQELDLWWSDRSTREKEHIAERINAKLLGNRYTDVTYPTCSAIWLSALSHEQKQAIYEHCKDGHGFEDGKESEGKVFSY